MESEAATSGASKQRDGSRPPRTTYLLLLHFVFLFLLLLADSPSFPIRKRGRDDDGRRMATGGGVQAWSINGIDDLHFGPDDVSFGPMPTLTGGILAKSFSAISTGEPLKCLTVCTYCWTPPADSPTSPNSSNLPPPWCFSVVAIDCLRYGFFKLIR
jgi:hypothetical protein